MTGSIPTDPPRRRRRGLRVRQARCKRAYDAIEVAAIALRCQPDRWPWLQSRPDEIARAEQNVDSIRRALIYEAKWRASIAWKSGAPPKLDAEGRLVK